MKQQNSRIVVEVNKLIANALFSDGGLYLPQIGSISIVTTTPEDGDPTREIAISEESRFKSLTEVISERGNCTLEQAEQVYKRWKDVVTDDKKITIFGIGDIEDGKFTLTPQMFNKLNPVQAAKLHKQNNTTPKDSTTTQPPVESEKIKTKEKVEYKNVTARSKNERSKKGYIWGLAAAIVLIIGVTYFVTTFNTDVSKEARISTIQEEPSQVNRAIEDSLPEPEVVAVAPTQAPAPQSIDINGDPTEVLQQTLEQSKSSTSKFRVVFGVFSSPSNSGRAIINVAKMMTEQELTIRAYPYSKETYLLTVFESDNEAECEAFKKSDIGRSISNDLWVYERK